MEFWGSIAEWVAAFAAVSALAAAVWAGRTSAALFTIERARDHANANRIRQQQATLVSAWTVSCPDHELELSGGAPIEERDGVRIQNSSNAPVHDVVVRSSSLAGTNKDATLSIVPPGDLVMLRNKKFPWSLAKPRSYIKGAIHPITKRPEWRVHSIAFTDASGVRWERSGSVLRELNGGADAAPAMTNAAHA
jgi:hypothetical protein